MVSVPPCGRVGRFPAVIAFRKETGSGVGLSSTGQVGEITQLKTAPGNFMLHPLFRDQGGHRVKHIEIEYDISGFQDFVKLIKAA